MASSLDGLRNGGRAMLAMIALSAAAASAWPAETPSLDELKRSFARPDAVPMPASNPGTPEEIALGAALFSDARLSRDGSHSCVTCHDPARGFTDGASRGKGVAGVTLKRNTPTLWNLAWASSLFWDGRAATLEAQARGPIEHPLEMDRKLADAVVAMKADPETVKSFTAVFGVEGVTEANVLKALAAYERTLVSPRTRFDRWVEGDESALTDDEIKGFKLFTGRAACSKCHSGWRLTDEAYHDIGLPEGPDKGRGEVAGEPRMSNAFKTPTLRELVWTAPYMHDGSLATLEAANDHYFGGVENRPTISHDVPLITPVSTVQRGWLTAFLKTLSSDTPPAPVALPIKVEARVETTIVAATEVTAGARTFSPAAIRVETGATLTIRNADERTHIFKADDPRVTLSSDVQEPGTALALTFPASGTYTVTCLVQPGMRLTVVVE